MCRVFAAHHRLHLTYCCNELNDLDKYGKRHVLWENSPLPRKQSVNHRPQVPTAVGDTVECNHNTSTHSEGNTHTIVLVIVAQKQPTKITNKIVYIILMCY